MLDYYGTPVAIKHLPGQHDQQAHAGLLHATTEEFMTSIDEEGFRAGSYFLLGEREHTNQHIKAALEEIVQDRVIEFGSKGTVGDPIGLAIYEVDLDGLEDNDTEPDWELPEDAVKIKVPLNTTRIVSKHTYKVNLRNLLREAYNLANRDWYGQKRAFELGESSRDPGSFQDFIELTAIPLTSSAVDRLMAEDDLLEEIKAQRGRRGLTAVLVKLKSKNKSSVDFYQTPV